MHSTHLQRHANLWRTQTNRSVPCQATRVNMSHGTKWDPLITPSLTPHGCGGPHVVPCMEVSCQGGAGRHTEAGADEDEAVAAGDLVEQRREGADLRVAVGEPDAPPAQAHKCQCQPFSLGMLLRKHNLRGSLKNQQV